MKLKILHAGRYNNEWHEADDYLPGETLSTSESYGALLVMDGLAEEIPPEPAEPEAQTAPHEQKTAPKPAATPRSGRKNNPFVPKG